MEVVDLTFDQPVARMTFSCSSGDIVAAQSQTLTDNETTKEDLQSAAQTELLAEISRKLTAVQEEMSALNPLVRSTAVEFAESFVGLLFECDMELANEKIVSGIKLALAEADDTSGITIYLNPKMINRIEQALRNLGQTEPQFISDPLLPISDCRIEGSGIAVISRLQRQLEAARNQCLKNNNDEFADD